MSKTEITLVAIIESVRDMRMAIRAKMDEIEDQGAVDIKMYGLYAVEYITLTNVMELVAGYMKDIIEEGMK